MSAIVETRDLTRRYGATLALDHLNLQVPEGAIFGFIGPNGAGKTTTMRILTTLLLPASGLDPRARIELRELLRELRALGKTILISSHILTELAEMCTHIAIIERGRLLASGDVETIMRSLQPHRTLELRVLSDSLTGSG